MALNETADGAPLIIAAPSARRRTYDKRPSSRRRPRAAPSARRAGRNKSDRAVSIRVCPCVPRSRPVRPTFAAPARDSNPNRRRRCPADEMVDLKVRVRAGREPVLGMIRSSRSCDQVRSWRVPCEQISPTSVVRTASGVRVGSGTMVEFREGGPCHHQRPRYKSR